MFEMLPDSDGEIGSEALTSSQSSSMSSSGCGRCSSLSRSSIEAAAPPFTSLSSSSSNFLPSFSSSSRKPHSSSSDPAWTAILRRPSPLGPRDFRLLRRIGRGDIGTVYLCRLRDDKKGRETDTNSQLYAMKVVDRREMEKKKKLGRAEAERRALKSLDHPFLPTLYADFDASPHYSCVVMEFCPAGDLHSLRHRQPSKRFSLQAARFYAAEVLVAVEYLHMLGIVYRDLKPENVLIRSDGHIMLSDFDLSLESTTTATLHDRSPLSSSSDEGRFPSCFPFFKSSKRKLLRQCTRRFVAEPVDARSSSFVGTHEYVAPEVAAGRAHGSAVDWWAFGVFLYELLHGRTPFAGPTNESTLHNIVKQPLTFPATTGPPLDPKAKDLISRLLAKDPTRRLGSVIGAADVKSHPFFSGLNFALLRSQRAPVVPAAVGPCRSKPPRFEYF